MWGRKGKSAAPTGEGEPPSPLKEAMHQARIEAAERTSVVVDLRDAEVARLELLNEVLNPLFADIPPEVDLFDRGISRGDTPRLWIDAVAHVAMGRDKRVYRFLHDTRIGRRVFAEFVRDPGDRESNHRICGASAHRAGAGAGRGSGIRHPHRPAGGGARAAAMAPTRMGLTGTRFRAGSYRAPAHGLAVCEPHVTQ